MLISSLSYAELLASIAELKRRYEKQNVKRHASIDSSIPIDSGHRTFIITLYSRFYRYRRCRQGGKHPHIVINANHVNG